MHCAKVFERACRDTLVHIRHCDLKNLPSNVVGRQLLDVRRPDDGKICKGILHQGIRLEFIVRACICRKKARVMLQVVMLAFVASMLSPMSNRWLQ